MSTLDSPSQSSVSAEVDPTFRALRAVFRPYEYQAFAGSSTSKILGHYRAVGTATAAAYASNAILGAFRYTDANSFAVILQVQLIVSVVTAVTAQRVDPAQLFVARGYTAADVTNATTLTTSGNNQKLRSSMGTSLATVTVTSAAAGQTGGTKVVDANPVGQTGMGGIGGLGTASGSGPNWLYKQDEFGAHPLVLAANEGILVQWGATAVATGTVEATIQIDWAEVPAF